MLLVQELERTRDETLKCFSLGAGDVARTYGPGKWSVAYILHYAGAHNEHHLSQVRLALGRQV